MKSRHASTHSGERKRKASWGAVLAAFALLAAFGPTDAAYSQESSDPSGRLFFSEPAAPVSDPATTGALERIRSEPTTVRAVVQVVHPEVLKSSSVAFNVFDEIYVFSTTYVDAKTTEWHGGDEAGGSALIVTKSGATTGTIRTSDGKVFSILPIAGDLVGVVEVDARAFPSEGEPLHEGPGDVLDLADAPENADDGSVFTVIVPYTASARAYWGSTANIEARILLGEAESNEAYADSDIAPRMDVVHMYETPTAETGTGTLTDFGTDVTLLRNNGDGSFDEVHALRDQYAADFVALVTNYSAQQLCGLAYAIGSTADTAFSITEHICISPNYTFVHEIAHNVGSRHDPAADPNTTPFAYGHGHVFTGTPSGDTYRTIMGLGSSCANCPRIKLFSNPDVVYDGTAAGTTATSDNARVHDERAFTIANFRADPPANDDFVDAEILPGLSGAGAGSNLGATGEPGESPSLTCRPTDSQVNSVWWSWTPPVSGSAQINTVGSDFDTTLAVFTGSTVSTITEVPSGCNDDIDFAGGVFQSSVTIDVTAGTTYLIRVDGYNANTGTISLQYETLPPANDDFTDASLVSDVGPSSVSVETSTATTEEPDEDRSPTACDIAPAEMGHTVWYRIDATSSGEITLDTLGSNYDTVLAVWTGGSLAGLSMVDCNDDIEAGNARSSVTFSAASGTTYFGQVGGYDDAAGTLVLNSTGIGPPAQVNEFGFFQPLNGRWYVQGESSVGYSAGDPASLIPTPGDFDGDGLDEFAFYQPDNGRWYVQGQSSVGFSAGDPASLIPVPGNYTGDDAWELAFYRPDIGRWYVQGQSSVGFSAGDPASLIPTPGDFDGDGLEEFAFYRPDIGRWYVQGQSSVGFSAVDPATLTPLPANYT